MLSTSCLQRLSFLLAFNGIISSLDVKSGVRRPLPRVLDTASHSLFCTPRSPAGPPPSPASVDVPCLFATQ